MENKQLVKKLERAIEGHNDFYFNNSEIADDPFYKSQIEKYNQEICNLCKQIQALHTEQDKPIL
jgi:protein-tyrosine-phosphatase